MIRIILFAAGLMLAMSACVTNKKYMYLQKDDVNAKDLIKDSILRNYSTIPFDYKIQPNDALYIRFVSLTDEKFDFLSTDDFAAGGGTGQAIQLRSELVDEMGEISFPEIGKVKVVGLTVFQVQDTLQKISDQYLNAPSVKVRLVNFRFTVLGEVDAEGTITTINNRVTLLEALGLAGGLGDLADRANVKVIRQSNGKADVAYIDLLDENFILSPYYYINQNDVIIVPALRQRPFREYFGQNLSLFISSLSLLLLVINFSK